MANKHALLATVVRTWGSSPRPIGSVMALAEDGHVVGSVSGGCIEQDLIDHFTRACSGDLTSNITVSGPPVLMRYGVTADEAHRFGLPCGGTLELLLEHDPDANLLSSLVTSLMSGGLVQRVTRISDGAVTLFSAESPCDLIVNSDEVVNTFGPEYRMLVVGAGQIAECLSTMAVLCGFSVTVCDPREEYQSSFYSPDVTLVRDMPDDAVKAFRPDRRSSVIALTHDPKLDDLALLEALESEAFYVGAIGSRRNNETRRCRLMEHFGHSETSLELLRGPIGIFIGSKTPPEIAVSVMAEVLAVKNSVVLPHNMQVGTAKKFLDLAQRHRVT